MKHLKLFFALFAMLALGVGNAWGQTFTRISSANDLVDGDEIIFVNQAGTHACGTTQNTNNRTPVAITTSDNSYSFKSADNVQVFVVKKNGSNYGFHTGAGYIYSASSSKNYLKTNTTASTTSPTGISAWTLSVSGDVFTVKNVTNTSYYLAFNSTDYFSQYKQGQSKPYIYKKQSSSSSEPLYSVTVNQPTTGGTISATGLTEGKAAAGAIVKLTATPDASYKWKSWTVTGASGDVVVSNNQFTMPAEEVTVTASFVPKTQYTIKWNVAEGSVDDTKVYEGDALGTLPTADNCSSGKVFVGWTEATSVNADGSGITYAKSTDVPAGNKEYNAVYALEGEEETEETSIVNFSGGGKEVLGAIEGITSYGLGTDYAVSNAPYQVKLDGTGDYIQFNNSSAYQITTIELVVKMLGGGNTSTLKIQTSNDGTTFTDLNSWSISGSQDEVKSTTITVNDTYNYLRFHFTKGSNVGLGKLVIKAMVSKTSYTNYSLDCEANNEPFLTVIENAIDFGTVAQNETVTETFTVTGGYLAEDVALTISGTNASYFSISPATITKADDVEETVTVTYNPTATGDHTATLTIKTGDITKEIALSGKVLAPGKWVLVKDVATLSAGDEIIIAAANADYAIGEAASNNYKGAAITKVGETANADAGVTVLKVEATGVAEAPYALKDGSKYLYAAGPSNNYLKAQATNNVNGQWAVTITAEGVASIVAAKSENRNVMQFNPNNGNPIFACYASASQSALAIYRNSENVVKPVISGDADFVGSTQVTITAQSGLTVYYTTDGSDPDNTSTQYTAPFTINETTTVKAIAYDASSNASGVAEMTFTKHDLVNVATAMALAKDEIAYFDEFEVVKVVTGTQYIYIKDASGHGLIYDLNLATQLSDGDRVQGFVGISAPYGGLPEAKPVDGLTVADLTITSGVAAEPYDFTSTAIASTDINKYIVFNDVAIAANTDVSTNPTMTIGGNSVNLYNKFNISKTLEAGKTYDIYGFVAIYNGTLQVYFYQALEEGEVVTKYTVTYNAGGATGEVPVDDNEYTEGAQVYLKSATGLTKEGYDYKGWKVTDEGGNEIAVSSNKFNMPASNVTVTAQWEEIVAPEIQDFSTGYWVLVTDANKIEDGDKIVIAAADENFAMKSYESGNNCKQVAVTKLGDQLLKWTSEIGVFQLIANGSNYTIQDVNTEQYLYAAGTGSDNHLKAAYEVPADAEAAKPYIWTISYTDGVPTVKATSDNRNTLRYNTGSDLFACYASGQKDIALYKYVTDYTYTHTPNNNYGTICLPYASASTTGAYFYQVVGQGTENGKPAVYLESVNTLAAGVPYIFEKTANQIKVVYTGEAVDAPQNDDANGLVGTFVETTVPDGDYILYNNAFCTNEDGPVNKIRAYRAYLDMDAVEGGAPQQMPGRRYIGMSVQGENEATGFENITAPAGKTVKAIVNGQLIIIRDGEMYNAQGQRL